jgi:cysteinyl-tRNA synthetase
MRGAVLFDVVRNWLERLGFGVDFVQNFTDIDDKIIRRSSEEGIPVADVARKYGQMYFDDLERLGVRPARWVYVTENIPEIIAMIEKIIANGHAYAVDGDVYFRVTSSPHYGKLSRRKLDEMQAGARIEIDERKQHPMDFALWKAAKPGEPLWASPWGEGRPGWHIECSALSLKELGADFDLHAGGTDLVFPHHENEIAQSEAFLGKPSFARIWMHWGAVRMAGDKMSKSTGNVLAVREVIEAYSAGAVRLFLLGADYRSPIEYSENRMRDAQSAYERITTALGRARRSAGSIPGVRSSEEYVTRFAEAMNGDFNTAAAIGVVQEAVRELNETMASPSGGDDGRVSELAATVEELGSLLGLPLSETDDESDGLVGPLMDVLIRLRATLREQKQFDVADQLRGELASVGVLLEDSVDGTTWRRG